jgi:hypothetical protein
MRGAALRDAFKAHTAQWNLKPETAAAMIFRAELTERWLAKAVAEGLTQVESHARLGAECPDDGTIVTNQQRVPDSGATPQGRRGKQL